MRNNYWARIRRTRLSDHDVDRPWLIKIYPPGEENYFNWLSTSRARTFEDAIRIAHDGIRHKVMNDHISSWMD